MYFNRFGVKRGGQIFVFFGYYYAKKVNFFTTMNKSKTSICKVFI